MNIFGVKIIKNHADYRLLSQRALKNLSAYKETRLFLRAIVLDMGQKPEIVYFDVKPRYAGDSKYSLKKMLYLCVEWHYKLFHSTFAVCECYGNWAFWAFSCFWCVCAVGKNFYEFCTAGLDFTSYFVMLLKWYAAFGIRHYWGIYWQDVSRNEIWPRILH